MLGRWSSRLDARKCEHKLHGSMRDRDELAYHAGVIAAHGDGCPLPNLVGFIDGTAIPICRPDTKELQVAPRVRVHACDAASFSVAAFAFRRMSLTAATRSSILWHAKL
jgi:hypothetical protein